MSWMKSPDGLAKLRVELPNHPHVSGEMLWAERVNDGLYELRNVPFHAYGLNFLDVVVAEETVAGEPPRIVSVRRPSGHRTLRVCFTEACLFEERVPTLMTLRRFGATFEGASQSYFAIDIPPDGDHEAVALALTRLQEQGLVTFESGEARTATAFDAPALADV